MIKIIKIEKSKTYKKFLYFYDKALELNQKRTEIVSISSYDSQKHQVFSRYVNLKYIKGNEWIFFSNYNSPKSLQFQMHEQISALFYWDKLSFQLRIKAKIKKSNKSFSDAHFKKRSKEKNALSISSAQSEEISSYEDVIKKYNSVLEKENLIKRPEFWGGFSFVPYYFEFWEGKENRLNKREVFEYKENNWINFILEP